MNRASKVAVAVLGFGWTVGCTSPETAPETSTPDALPTISAEATPSATGSLAHFRATWSKAKGLAFTPLKEVQGPGVGTTYFVEDATSHFTFTTSDATAGPGAGALADCGATQFCATINLSHDVTNADSSNRTLNNIWVPVEDMVPSTVSVLNSDTFGNALAYAFSSAAGQFTYGSLATNVTSSDKRWNFQLPVGFDTANDVFTFNVAVFGTWDHSGSATFGGYDAANITGEALDACAQAGNTEILNPDSGFDAAATVQLPFEHSLFRMSTYDAGLKTNAISVTENGSILFGTSLTTTGSNRTLPTAAFSGGTSAYLPYWDDLDITTESGGPGGQVCTWLENGSAPGRTFVITWKSLTQISSGETVNFSVRFREGTDVVEYHYWGFSALTSATRGQNTVEAPSTARGVTFGLQGIDNAEGGKRSKLLGFNSVYLPATLPFGVSLTPTN